MLEITGALAAARAVEALAAPTTQVVTLTITEKGYGLTPASGELDGANADVAADLADAWPPRTALGLLAARAGAPGAQRAAPSRC